MERHRHDSRVIRLIVALVAVETMLVALFLAIPRATRGAWLFNLNGEFNVPAFFSAVQLAMIGCVLLRRGRNLGENRATLLVFGMLFLFLGFDEGLGIHERITESLRGVHWVPRFYGDHGIWIFVYLGTGVVAAALSWRHLFRLWRDHRGPVLLLAVGAGIVLFGAAGLEIFTYEWLGRHPSTLLERLEVAAEEFCEMIGATIILFGALTLPSLRSVPAGRLRSLEGSRGKRPIAVLTVDRLPETEQAGKRERAGA